MRPFVKSWGKRFISETGNDFPVSVYVKDKNIRFLKLLKLRYPNAFRLITLIALLVPSVNPFVYLHSKKLRIYFEQFPSIVRHGSNSFWILFRTFSRAQVTYLMTWNLSTTIVVFGKYSLAKSLYILFMSVTKYFTCLLLGNSYKYCIKSVWDLVGRISKSLWVLATWTVVASFAIMKKWFFPHKRNIFNYRSPIIVYFISQSRTKRAGMCFHLERKENMN